MGDGTENGNFLLLYVLKMSLHRRVGGSKETKTPLRNIKMVPKENSIDHVTASSSQVFFNSLRRCHSRSHLLHEIVMSSYHTLNN